MEFVPKTKATEGKVYLSALCTANLVPAEAWYYTGTSTHALSLDLFDCNMCVCNYTIYYRSHVWYTYVHTLYSIPLHHITSHYCTLHTSCTYACVWSQCAYLHYVHTCIRHASMHPCIYGSVKIPAIIFLRETMVGSPPGRCLLGVAIYWMFLSQIPWKICLKALYLSG